MSIAVMWTRRIGITLLLAAAAWAQEGGPTISGSVPNGTVGVAYSATLTWNGGENASWGISAGSLPPGLGLTSQGGSATISGIPNTAGTYSFTVRATENIETALISA